MGQGMEVMKELIQANGVVAGCDKQAADGSIGAVVSEGTAENQGSQGAG